VTVAPLGIGSSTIVNTVATMVMMLNVRSPAGFCDHSRSTPRSTPSAVENTIFITSGNSDNRYSGLS
jgi:hypothetical protein